jgi:muramoyltetrapeptide carboxypeptidase LdcA involved in peptidoglycan recycling
LLGRFAAVIVARPKAWERFCRNTATQKQEYAQAQRAAILRPLSAYAPDAMVVFNVDFGHTDPQLVLPYGGDIRIDGPNRTIAVCY